MVLALNLGQTIIMANSDDILFDQAYRDVMMAKPEFHAIYEIMVLMAKLEIIDIDKDYPMNSGDGDLVRYIRDNPTVKSKVCLNNPRT